MAIIRSSGTPSASVFNLLGADTFLLDDYGTDIGITIPFADFIYNTVVGFLGEEPSSPFLCAWEFNIITDISGISAQLYNSAIPKYKLGVYQLVRRGLCVGEGFLNYEAQRLPASFFWNVGSEPVYPNTTFSLPPYAEVDYLASAGANTMPANANIADTLVCKLDYPERTSLMYATYVCFANLPESATVVTDLSFAANY